MGMVSRNPDPIVDPPKDVMVALSIFGEDVLAPGIQRSLSKGRVARRIGPKIHGLTDLQLLQCAQLVGARFGREGALDGRGGDFSIVEGLAPVFIGVKPSGVMPLFAT